MVRGYIPVSSSQSPISIPRNSQRTSLKLELVHGQPRARPRARLGGVEVARRKLEVTLDHSTMPIIWDATWKRWRHLLGTKVELQGTFVQLRTLIARLGEAADYAQVASEGE